MRWLLLKDLQILRRSPLLVCLLIGYPVLIALLVGFALSRGPDKPKVALLNQVTAADNAFTLGGEEIDGSRYAQRLLDAVQPVRVDTRAQALQAVRSGDALAALIVPADIARKLRSGTERPVIEVVYNIEDPVKARFVEATLKARLGDANQALAKRKFAQVADDYLGLLLSGGSFALFGEQVEALGLRRVATIARATIEALPDGSPQRRPLEQVERFARLAIDNLDLSDEELASVASPLAIRRTVLKGANTPLDAFAVAVAVTISLMFITMLLASGMLALEREEHAFSRLVRGLVSRTALLTEKVGLAALCSFAVTLLMLAGLGGFIGLDWGRFGLWVLALAAGALGFAAMGAAIGSLTREVRTASLLAFMLSLPIAFLALVPSGAVAGGLYDVIRVISALFPFKPALQAMNAALNDADPGLLGPLAHLAALTLASAPWPAWDCAASAEPGSPRPRPAPAAGAILPPWPSPPPACAACAAPGCCATWSGRPTSRRPSSCCRCSWPTGPTAASRSRPCPASTSSRSPTPSTKPVRPRLWACRRSCSSACRPRRTIRAALPGTTRAWSSWPRGRSRKRTLSSWS